MVLGALLLFFRVEPYALSASKKLICALDGLVERKTSDEEENAVPTPHPNCVTSSLSPLTTTCRISDAQSVCCPKVLALRICKYLFTNRLLDSTVIDHPI